MTLFGSTPDGRDTHLFILQNRRGLRAEITDYGGTLVRLFTPDRHGQAADVVLGFDRVEDYVAHSPYFGCIIGRCGNRIARGTFSLDGRTHRLATNNSPAGHPCHLHGGARGFDKVVWEAEPFSSGDDAAVRLRHRSPDGDEGYPGALDVTVTYTLTAADTLRIDYLATTDRPTPVNLTHHTYFNLAGEGSGDVLGHVLTLPARNFTPVDAGLIPTGAVAPVAHTPFDFTAPHKIGERIDVSNEQLRFAGGYDHNFVLDRRSAASTGSDTTPALVPAATLFEPVSGRLLEIETTEPGLQFYSGNFLAGAFAGKNGHVYPRRAGLCLETQHFPDSPNQPSFPSVILRPGQTYRSTTVHRFSAR